MDEVEFNSTANALMGWAELQECYSRNPEGYQENLFIGLFLSRDRVNLLRAEPYLIKALTFGQNDQYTAELLERLSWISQLKGNTEQAISLLSLAIKKSPNNLNLALQKGHALFQIGKSAEAFQLFQSCSWPLYKNAEEVSKSRGVPVTHLLEPHRLICKYIGEFAAKLDLYLKARALGLISGERAILCAPDKYLCNRAFATYWADHVEIVFGNQDVDVISREYRDFWVHLDYYAVPDGRTLQRDLAHRVVQKMWEDEGRPPLLKIKPEHRRKGRRMLSDAGMPPDAWFVCLYVREAGYFKENVPWGSNWYRNADIATYIPAIEEITSRGGWVVRIGDPTMKRLPAMSGVFDLAHNPDREDWMDIFAIADARFYMGMASGPAGIPPNFGVPVLGTNWFATGSWPFCKDDLFIHKLFKHKSDGRVLSVEEATAPPFYSALEPLLFAERELEVIDNSPGELAEVTVEMIERLNGVFVETEDDERRQNVYKRLADPYKLGMDPRVGTGFLKRYPELIGGH